MSFYVSKIAWFLINPGNLIMLAVLAGAGLSLIRRTRTAGRRLILGAVCVTVLLSLVPVGQWLVVVLERRFPQTELPREVDGVIVLAGLIDPELTRRYGVTELNGAADRLTEFLVLGQRYPDATLVYAGGSGSMHHEIGEAGLARALIGRMGGPVDRLIIENDSRTTAESAQALQGMVDGTNETWVLVTSARHMPRSVGAFRQAGLEVVPYPVDHATDGRFATWPMFSFVSGLGWLATGLYEWAGLGWYWSRGRIPTLFPGP